MTHIAAYADSKCTSSEQKTQDKAQDCVLCGSTISFKHGQQLYVRGEEAT